MAATLSNFVLLKYLFVKFTFYSLVLCNISSQAKLWYVSMLLLQYQTVCIWAVNAFVLCLALSLTPPPPPGWGPMNTHRTLFACPNMEQKHVYSEEPVPIWFVKLNLKLWAFRPEISQWFGTSIAVTMTTLWSFYSCNGKQTKAWKTAFWAASADVSWAARQRPLQVVDCRVWIWHAEF